MLNKFIQCILGKHSFILHLEIKLEIITFHALLVLNEFVSFHRSTIELILAIDFTSQPTTKIELFT